MKEDISFWVTFFIIISFLVKINMKKLSNFFFFMKAYLSERRILFVSSVLMLLANVF